MATAALETPAIGEQDILRYEADGVICLRGEPGRIDQITSSDEMDSGGLYTRMSSRYEAPRGTYDWLNKSIFVGLMLPPDDLAKVSMEIYEFA